MLRLERELQVHDVGTLQADHDVPLVGDHALLAALEEPLLLHEFEGVEGARALEAREEDPAETPGADALDDLEVAEAHVLGELGLPDGLDLEELSAEEAEGLASLEVVVAEDVGVASGPPVAEAARAELAVAYFASTVRSTSCSKRTMCGITVSCRLRSSQLTIGIVIRFDL